MVVRKMKEKCKDAARMRREKERAEFVELSKLLPLPISTTSQLDKASIIRLTSSYLRMRTAFPKGLGENWGNELRSSARKLLQQQPHQVNIDHQQFSLSKQPAIKELGSLILQTLDGFVFALHRDGKIMYISETASVHLGLPQIDLTGSSVFEYVHPSDHNDIYDILSLSESDKKQLSSSFSGSCQSLDETRELGRSFCMRMKCILPKRNAGLVTSGYKAIHCNGYLKVKCNATQQVAACKQEADWESYALVAVGRSLLPTASTEIRLGTNSFIFRANLDLRLYYIESAINKLLGFEQSEMVGQSLYQFVHLSDISHLEQSHRTLLEKGQVVSKYYRLMRKGGGCVWLQSNASLVNNPRNMPKPQHVICICFVLAENPSDESCLVQESEQIPATSSPDKVVAPNVSRPPLKGAGQLCRADKLIGGPIIAKTRNRKTIIPDLRPLVTSHSEVNQHISPSPIKAIHQEMQHNSSYQCSCMQNKHNFATIGSSRRSSDDTCSIVSSIASTSLSNGSSLGSSQLNHDLSTNYMTSDATYEQMTYSLDMPTRSNMIDDQQIEPVNTFYEFVEKPCENQHIWRAPANGHLEDPDDSQVAAMNEQTIISNGGQVQKCNADQLYFQSVSPNWTSAQVDCSDGMYINSDNQKQQNYHRLQINTEYECHFEGKQSTVGAINYSSNQLEAHYQESPLYTLNANQYHHVPTYNGYTMSSI